MSKRNPTASTSPSPPPVTVVRDRFVKGWPTHPDGQRAYRLPLGAALERTYSTDAHFAAYGTPNRRRLTTDAVGRVPIELRVFVLDVDCPEVHGTADPVPDLWRSDLGEKFWALQEDHPGGFLYHTRGGARIVYRIAPSVIRTPEDAARWSREYAVVCAYMGDRYGIHPDRACADWQRLYRLPHATRTTKPEQWPVLGDPNAIGTLAITPRRSHLAKAKLASPRLFGQRRERSSYSGDGRGAFFYALQARGHVVRDHRLGHVIVCPNSAQHTSGRDGDGSTILFPPGPGDALGWVHCLHAHCVDLTVRDWLALFGDEIRRAG